jgi:HSP20 family protein
VNPDDVDVTIQQETLTLSWKSTVAVPENARAQWIGFSASSQRQQLTLPSAVDAEHAVADYTNGVLTLTLPKAAHAKAHTVKVTARSQEPALA